MLLIILIPQPYAALVGLHIHIEFSFPSLLYTFKKSLYSLGIMNVNGMKSNTFPFSYFIFLINLAKFSLEQIKPVLGICISF